MSTSGKNDPQRTDIEKRVRETVGILKKRYPDTRPLLDHKNPFELLIATILAAQCTDERVNQVTKQLFRRLPNPGKMSKVPASELEDLIRPTGFFRAKAKSIKGASSDVMERFGGIIPDSLDDLVSLPGVGRKTANVILGTCYGKPAIIVDTHLKRVCGRMGFTFQKSPDKIELELKEVVPESMQTLFSMTVNFHGRYCCKARKPLCPDCLVINLCLFPEKTEAV